MGTQTQVEIEYPAPPGALSSDDESIAHFKRQANSGNHWFIAALEAISLWNSPRETYKGRDYVYLVGNEAFDWLLLAERLCEEVDGLVPEEEKSALLFEGRLPIDLDGSEFQRLLGPAKYKAHLNYFYGVVVEESIIRAMEERGLKELVFVGCSAAAISRNRAFNQLYGAGEEDLLRRFREDLSTPHADSITLNELREFTYWLFKYRLKHSDKAKVASDTKKGLLKLQEMWTQRRRVLARRQYLDQKQRSLTYQLV